MTDYVDIMRQSLHGAQVCPALQPEVHLALSADGSHWFSSMSS